MVSGGKLCFELGQCPHYCKGIAAIASMDPLSAYVYATHALNSKYVGSQHCVQPLSYVNTYC